MANYYKTIRENNDGKYIFVYAHEFKESIEFAKKNKLEQVQIRGVVGKENIDTISDFQEIEKLSPYLRVISFAGLLDNKITNFDSIYSLAKLEKINILCKQNFIIDVSRFNLKHLGVEYWKGLKNIGKIKSLESMVITHYPGENITEFLELHKLKVLHIYSSKIKTIAGIDKLRSLEELSLARNNKLETIHEIEKIKLLKKLSLEKCKNIKDYNFIKEMQNIEKLFIDGFIK